MITLACTNLIIDYCAKLTLEDKKQLSWWADMKGCKFRLLYRFVTNMNIFIQNNQMALKYKDKNPNNLTVLIELLHG